MENLKEEFSKGSNAVLSNEAYIIWLEQRVVQAEQEKQNVLDTYEKTRKITYSEEEVKQAIAQSFTHAFDCIKKGIGIDQIPNKIISYFEEIKKII